MHLQIEIDGAPAQEPCTAVLRAADGTEVRGLEEVTAAPGKYELRVICPRGSDRLAMAEPISLAAGAKIAKRLKLTSTRIRARASRDGARVKGVVLVYPRGGDLSGVPLLEGATDRKLLLASGRYDLVVRTDTPRASERAQVRLADFKASGAAIRDVEVDLSDGSLEVSLTENGKAAVGTFRVLLAQGNEGIASGESGTKQMLRPGLYTVETTLSSSADFAKKRSNVWVEPKKTARITERFTSGRLTVGVFREGQPIDAVVHLLLPGAAEFFNYFSAPGTASLSPGHYDVLVDAKVDLPGASALRRPRVSVAAGKENKIVFDLSPARLEVRVTRSGKPVELAEIRVLNAGGGAEAAKAEADGSYRLWPGRYEIVARLPEGDEARDGPFEMGFGERAVRRIDFARGAIIAHVVRGSAVAEDGEVFVFRPGAPRPVAQGRSGARLEISPGTYDVKVTAGSVTEWRQGVRVKEGASLRLDFQVGAGDAGALPEGDLAPWKGDLPEGDAP